MAVKAVALLSGGLDSQLAVKVVQEQGVEVTGINFKTPFFGPSPYVHRAARNLRIPLEVWDITEPHLQMLKRPKHGYGKHMNPCIDCHAMMVHFAGKRMEELGADFIITGEVLKQRPKSQNLHALALVERESGYPGLVLRPLSAKLLPPTIPEIRGLVDREKLLDIQGRSRLRQLELARKYGITDYPSPAGGCILTDEGFSRRLRVLFEQDPNPRLTAIELLKVGRHFVFDDGTKLIVGRNESENASIEKLAQDGDILIKVANYPGPTGLLTPPPGLAGQRNRRQPALAEALPQAAAVVARYSDAKNFPLVDVKVHTRGGDPELLRVKPAGADAIPALRLI